MLLQREKLADYVGKPLSDPHSTISGTVCVSAESREAVDELADAALAAGGTQVKDPLDHGFMYGRSFYDLDGHHWAVMWIDPAAIEAPADASAAAA